MPLGEKVLPETSIMWPWFYWPQVEPSLDDSGSSGGAREMEEVLVVLMAAVK